MATLTGEQILGVDDIKKEAVKVPEWGGEVFVKMMTGAERDVFEQAMIDSRGSDKKANLQNIRARLAVLTICNEAGERLFTDAQVAALGKKSAAALDRIFEKAQKLNRIGKEDVEELSKNDASGQSAASGSN